MTNMNNPHQEEINMLPDAGGNWRVSRGIEVDRLLNNLAISPSSTENLLRETAGILSLCGDPQQATNNETGLVFGYVQSGKTMSFTMLTAMAKDNGYQIVIIIAGISTNLVDQSFTRLEKDLQIDIRKDQQWLSFKNLKPNDQANRNLISNVLEEWRDSTYPKDERRTILITVMKQRNHLPNLREVLRTVDLTGVPVLIIDDEADQASMNTRAHANARRNLNEMSPIHRRIVELREAIPHHTFIQYTATPQAPLFISIMDNLSPNFIQLLTPGEDYTGGRVFFDERPELVVTIEDIDEHPNSPPESLLRAMKIFFLGVAKGRPDREFGNRCMMVHPSQLTHTHDDYFTWVTEIKTNWVDILSLPDSEADKVELLAEFREAYDELSETTSDLPDFEILSGSNLMHLIRATEVKSLNSMRGNNTNVNWKNSYSFILIGGQAMDRGFTVEGLTLTYMPRGIGVGNADTIQQRARFFGYKRAYLGYCRVYLDAEARHSYESYVEHEEDMRRRLEEHNLTGRILNEWPREVFLDSQLNLTRANVIGEELERSLLEGWLVSRHPHYSADNIIANRGVIESFLANHPMPNPETNAPNSVTLSLLDVYEELILPLRFASPADFRNYLSLQYLIELFLGEFPDSESEVYLMSTFDAPRSRSLNPENNYVNQLFQGRSSKYAGDREFKNEELLTIQIHILNMKDTQLIQVPALGIHIPESAKRHLIRVV